MPLSFQSFPLLLSIACLAMSARAQTVDQWREDLRTLRQTVVGDYRHLFHDVSQEYWERAADELDRRIPELQRHEIIVELSQLVAAFRIGHTYLQLGNWRGPEAPAKFHTIPLVPYLYRDGLYVMSAAKTHERWVGARIVQIGEWPAAEAIERVRPAVIYENEMGFRNAISYFLNCPEVLHACGVIDDPARVPLTFDVDGQTTEVTFDAEPARHLPGFDGIQFAESDWVDACRLPFDQRPLWLRNLNRKRDCAYLPEQKILYVRHSVVLDEADETIEAFFAKVFASDAARQADKLVLDVRLNSGGNNYLNKPVITGAIRSKFNERGRFFVIAGRKTFSACQNLVNELEKYTEAIFVGEPTAERVNFWGDNRELILPNSKLSVSLSWLWWQNSDPRDQRIWKAPDILVELSPDQFRDGVDPALDAIAAWRPQAPIEKQVEDYLAQHDLAAAGAFVKRLVADPQNRFGLDRIERQVNLAGYAQLKKDEVEAAIAVFKLNVELFPNSPSAYGSYAEASLKFGNRETAVQNYRRAMELDPHGPIGQNSAAALRQLGTW
jgi:tetratricopeptide (TPR) repeat protein